MNLTQIFAKIDQNQKLTLNEIIFLLQIENEDLFALYAKADAVRKEIFGDEVFLRGIIEFSNYCKKNCYYCGIQRTNKNLLRYRIPDEEIIACCQSMEKKHQTTVVLQSGEDAYYTKERFSELLARIKSETNLAITVSVGERDEATYAYWQKQGMDRYLLRFETSNPGIFRNCHPDDNLEERLNCIYTLKKLGVQTGSGFLIGLPNQTYQDLAEDILFCTKLNLEMIGCGPFIPHPETKLGQTINPFPKEVYFKTMAILRLLNKKAHIPSTTAFDAIDPQGRNLLLQRGANIFMPNSTPKKYRKYYQLYPGKPCVDESAEDCAGCVVRRIQSLGRKVGVGPGHAVN